MVNEVTIAICTKNRPESLERCIKSLKKQTFKKFSIIVVFTGDNAAKKVCEKYNIKFIEEKQPGRCRARNTAIKKTKGDIIIFFDDDVEAEKNCVKELVKLYTNDQIGVVGGSERKKNVKFSFTQSLQNFIFHKINPYSSIKNIEIRTSGRVTGNFREGKKSVEVDHVKGNVMSFKREALCSVKGFDQWFDKTAHREETDVSFRISKTGYKILYNPRAKIKHHAESSGREGIYNFMLNNFKQHQYFVFKNSIISGIGIIEYVIGEILEITTIFLYSLYFREPRLNPWSVLKYKAFGIMEGMKARHLKGLNGDLNV